MTNSDWVPTAEASRISGLSTSALVRRARAGSLRTAAKAPGLRGAYFFHRADIQALTKSSEQHQESELTDEPSALACREAAPRQRAPVHAVPA